MVQRSWRIKHGDDARAAGIQDTTTYICTDFANVAAAGAYDMLNAGIYVRADSNNAGNSMGISNAGIAGRWID